MSDTCPDCGADITPEHCMGEADYPGDFDELTGMIDRPRCDLDSGVCICNCQGCNPQCECWEDWG